MNDMVLHHMVRKKIGNNMDDENTEKLIEDLETSATTPRAVDIASIMRYLFDKNKELENRVCDLEYENKL